MKKKITKQSQAKDAVSGSGDWDKNKHQQQEDGPKQITLMTTLSEISKQQAKHMEMDESCLSSHVDKYDMERFINPVTREKTFKQLFDECDLLNEQSKTLRTMFFDAKANFLPDEYQRQPQNQITRKRFNQFKLWCKKLAIVVDELSRNYNDDLLNMFRLDV